MLLAADRSRPQHNLIIIVVVFWRSPNFADSVVVVAVVVAVVGNGSQQNTLEMNFSSADKTSSFGNCPRVRTINYSS